MIQRPLTETEREQIHPSMQTGADAGKQWRLPHVKPTSAVIDMRFVSPPPREKRARQYMADNPKGWWCSRCGDPVPTRSDQASCVCARCLQLLCQLEKHGYWEAEDSEAGVKAGRICMECGAERHGGRRKGRCRKCARARKTEQTRAGRRNSQKPAPE